MDVYTNVDTEAQKLWDIYNTDEYVNYPDDEMQVASTVIDVNTVKSLLSWVLVTNPAMFPLVQTKRLKRTVTGVQQ